MHYTKCADVQSTPRNVILAFGLSEPSYSEVDTLGENRPAPGDPMSTVKAPVERLILTVVHVFLHYPIPLSPIHPEPHEPCRNIVPLK